MLELIAELPEKRGCTIMISTHLLTDVDRVCDSALIMHLGQVRFSGTIEQLRTKHDVARAYVVEVRENVAALYDLVTANGATAQAYSPVGLTVTLPPTMLPSDIVSLARRAGLQVRVLDPVRETIEQAFLRVIATTEDALGAGAHA